jgi:hypothetical protein
MLMVMVRRFVLLLAGLLVVLGAPAGAWAAGDVTEAFCPNEGLPGFESYMPDCRAYEMVTPPFKNGQAGRSGAISSDGSRVLTRSLTSFPGAEGNSGLAGSAYELVRSGSGWGVLQLSPPASRFGYSQLVAKSGDLEETLWQTREASQSVYASDLYLREADGSFVEVGPLVPPSLAEGPPSGADKEQAGEFAEFIRLAGVSADLSHILFQVGLGSKLGAEAPVWPGDTTAKEGVAAQSLYEYAGVGNARPRLVGVNGEGRLISDCGTVLGAEGRVHPSGAYADDVYNAVSADGEAVFFTAHGQDDPECAQAVAEGAGSVVAPAVTEVWARRGGVESVPVSEPTSVQCRECEAGAVRRPAVFQGASEDGSKVFFLTEQELFEGNKGMNLYEYDFDNPQGRKIVRVSQGSETPEVQGVARVSEDGSHVYFVAKGVLSGRNAEGGEPVAGGENLYVFELDATYPAGHVVFVATLSEADAEDWSLEDRSRPEVTPDGRFLVFESVADLTPGDTSSERQVFEYDALRERLVRVSTGQAGYAAGLANANAHSSEIPLQVYGSGFEPTTANSVAVSVVDERGQTVSRVVFQSVGALTPGAEEAAAAGASSVYEYRSVGSIADGDVYLLSDGRNRVEGVDNSTLVGMDASGEDAFFATADPLLAQDVDTQGDIYDARTLGGFPAAAVAEGCEGEGCQDVPSLGPSFGAAGSVSAVAGGNLPPAPAESGPVAPKHKPKPKPKHKPKHKSKRRRGVKSRPVKGKGSSVRAKGQG